MKKIFLNYILPIFSFSSMITGINDLCINFWWRIFIVLIAVILLVISFVFIKRKAQKSIILILILSSLTISGVMWKDYSSYRRNEKIYEQWKDYLQEKSKNSNSYTPLEYKAHVENDAGAQYELALTYLYSKNVYELNYKLGTELLQRSADQGNPDANIALADIYINGMGCVPDTTRALSNLILALKNGNLDVSKYLANNNLDRPHLSDKDKDLVYNSLNDALFIDSTYYAFYDNSFELNNIERIKQLSDNGYYLATELLLYKSILFDNNKEDTRQYSTQLYTMGRIPDSPLARYLFWESYYGDSYNYFSSEKEFVERSIKNQDFRSLAFRSGVDYIHDIFYRYEYNLSQLKRAKYLLENESKIYRPSIFNEGGFDELYSLAIKSLSKSTKELYSEMRKQPYIFNKKEKNNN